MVLSSLTSEKSNFICFIVKITYYTHIYICLSITIPQQVNISFCEMRLHLLNNILWLVMQTFYNNIKTKFELKLVKWRSISGKMIEFIKSCKKTEEEIDHTFNVVVFSKTLLTIRTIRSL